MASSFRTERDSMGELKVPAEALWGAQTQRAVQNFPISGVSMPREFIAALALVKQAAARCVCAPHSASAGTLSSPMLSRSVRKELVMHALRGAEPPVGRPYAL